MKKIIRQELRQSLDILQKFKENKKNIDSIECAAEIMISCIKSGGKIIACGNGGSMSDAMHFASELTGRYRKDRPPIPAIAISDPGHLSCVANDFGYEQVFSRFIEAHGKEGDVVLFLSTSGTSANINSGIATALNKNIKGILITGIPIIGGEWAFPTIVIPHRGTADRIQEVTIVVIHILVHLIEKGLGYA